MSITEKRANEIAMEVGAYNWLTSLPLKDHGFILNKQEFRDALGLRYGLFLPGLPSHCACGLVFDIDHSMQCKKGGFISQRHHEI